MAFPCIYEDTACPLDGYEGYTFRILANPTQQQKIDWVLGNLGDPDCEDCKKIEAPGRCERHTASRAQFARGALAIYGTSKVSGFDFSSEAAALASFEQDMPDEFLAWLYMAPSALWEKRSDDLKKKLTTSSTTASS